MVLEGIAQIMKLTVVSTAIELYIEIIRKHFQVITFLGVPK